MAPAAPQASETEPLRLPGSELTSSTVSMVPRQIWLNKHCVEAHVQHVVADVDPSKLQRQLTLQQWDTTVTRVFDLIEMPESPAEVVTSTTHKDTAREVRRPALAPTLLDSIFASLLTPGAGPGLIATINGAIIALLCTLGGLAITGNADIHVAVMGFLALGLFASLQYFLGAVAASKQGDFSALPAAGNGFTPAASSDVFVTETAVADVGESTEEAPSSSRRRRTRVQA